MSTRVQRRRGSTAAHATFIGADGELTIDTDQKRLVIHDGATPGGIPMARRDEVTAEVMRQVGNADFPFQITDRLVAPNAVFSAPRTGTLPLANSVTAGRTISFFDALPAINGANVLTVARTGTDTINGAASYACAQPRGRWDFVSDGVSKWSVQVEQAPLASPAFTGAPTAPTATAGTNTTQLANTAFVKAAIEALIASAPGALDTLNELAAALGDDPDFAATVTTALAGKQPISAALTALAAVVSTAFGRARLADSNAAAARSALGVPIDDEGRFNPTRVADGEFLRATGPDDRTIVFSQYVGEFFWNVSGGRLTILTETADPIRLGTNGSERGRIDENGTLYWAATSGSPGYGGGIGLAIYANGAIGQGVTGSATNIVMQRDTDGAAFSFGRGALNTTPTAVGSVTLSATATSYNTSSDYRLKLDVTDLLGSGAFIDALRPREWVWTLNGERGVGFVAHEVQSVSPGSVTGEKDATNETGDPVYQGMQPGSSEIIAHMVAELQDLRRRVAVLEGA